MLPGRRPLPVDHASRFHRLPATAPGEPSPSLLSKSHLRTRAARSRMREEREILARLQTERGRASESTVNAPNSTKMIAASAGAELRPRLVAQPLSDRRNAPVFVHHIVSAALFELATDAKTRLACRIRPGGRVAPAMASSLADDSRSLSSAHDPPTAKGTPALSVHQHTSQLAANARARRLRLGAPATAIGSAQALLICFTASLFEALTPLAPAQVPCPGRKGRPIERPSQRRPTIHFRRTQSD